VSGLPAEPMSQIQLLHKVVQTLYWRVCVEDPKFVASSNWQREAFGKPGTISQQDLDLICHACNMVLEIVESPIRVVNKHGFIKPEGDAKW